MKKLIGMFAIVMALVLCLGVMTACGNKVDEETKKPTTSTNGDKNESKPSESKPATTKPTEDKKEESTQPSTGNNATTTQPAGGNSDSKPENDSSAQG